MKNIIPAVASTNALVSALAVSEAVKLLSFCGPSLNNFFGYLGHEGINSDTYAMEVRVRAPVGAACALFASDCVIFGILTVDMSHLNFEVSVHGVFCCELCVL